MIASLRTAALTAALIAGIMLGSFVHLSPVTAIVLGIAAVAVVGVFALRTANVGDGDLLPRQSSLTAGVLLVCVLLIGLCDMALHDDAYERARLPAHGGRVVEVAGVVISDPRPTPFGSSFTMRAVDVAGVKAREQVMVSLSGRGSRIIYGDRVVLTGKVKRLDPKDRFDSYLRNKRVVARLSAPASAVEMRSHSHNPFVVAAGAFRERLRLTSLQVLGQRKTGLLLGLLIGDVRFIPDAVSEDFRTSGLSHLTAVSGANLAMVLAAVLVLARLLRLSRRTQVFLALAAIAFFGLVTRWEPSVMRAAAMAAIAVSSFFLGRKASALNDLLAAVAILVALDPYLVRSVGFQLSVAATLGIVLLSARISSRLRGPRGLREALAVGLSAQAGVVPLLAVYFGRVSLVSVPANLAAFALVTPVTVAGMGAGVLAMLARPLATPLLWFAGILTGALERIAHVAASVPDASIPVRFKTVHLLISYLLISGGALWLYGQRRARWPIAAALLLLSISIALPVAAHDAPSGLRVRFFDVGQGDSALIESPAGATILVDGGRDGQVVLDKLRDLGVRRLDLVVFSHGHSDHVGGLPIVIDGAQVRKIMDPGTADSFADPYRRAGRVDAAREGEIWTIGDLSVQVLGPRSDFFEAASEADARSEGGGVNDASVVLRISWRAGCVLMTGDIEEPAQEALVEDHRSEIACSLMKAPHHGSAHLSEEFVQAVSAQWVAISVGPNRFGHPTRTALDMFARSGARIARTDRRGDLVMTMDAEGRVRGPG